MIFIDSGKILPKPKCKRICNSQKIWLIMKFSFLFLFTVLIHVNAENYAQTISLSVKNENLKNVLNEIKKQSGYQFFFNESMLRKTNLVTIDAKNETLKNILELCFYDQPVSYAIVNKTIVIKWKEVTIPSLPLLKQTTIIKGQVVSAQDNEPLAGVNIIIKNTSRGAVTDAEGKYQIEVEKDAI